MVQLYDRRCVLVAGPQPKEGFKQSVPDALRVDGLRMQFKIERDDKPKPNTSEILVYNLNEDSRALLTPKGFRVILSAGYKDSVAQIFSGDALNSDQVKKGVDWATKIQATDGGRAYRFARVSETFRSGTDVVTICKRIADNLELDPGNLVEKLSAVTRTFATGFAMHGKASRELTELLRPHKMSWSIQDGRIEVLADDDTVKDEVPLISPETGLIGSPEMGSPDKKGGKSFLKIRSLLLPRLRPGQKFKLEARGRNGEFKARKVTHTGDTHGGDWYTDIEASAVT